MTDPVLFVPRRFCGPPSSGNGGWTAGTLAGLVPDCPEDPDRTRVWPAVEVSLRMPPPLETPMPVTREHGRATAEHQGSVVADARCAEAEPDPVDPVG